MSADWLELEETPIASRNLRLMVRRDVRADREPPKPPSKAALYMRAYRKRVKAQTGNH